MRKPLCKAWVLRSARLPLERVEVAVGLAIIVAIFRARFRINVDDLALMRW